jgi:hypothetical protein
MTNEEEIKKHKQTIKALEERIEQIEKGITNYPPKGTPCEVWDSEWTHKQLAYSCGDGNFSLCVGRSSHPAYPFVNFKPLTTPKLGLWVARDEDKTLKLCTEKPDRFQTDWDICDDLYICLDEDLFPDLKWGDNPIEI